MSEYKAHELKEKASKPVMWVITELYYPENNQTGYYMTGITEGLAKSFDVKVICGQPNYAAKGTRAPKREIHRDVEIFRVWGTTLDKNVIFFRLVNMLTLGAAMFFKSLFKVKSKQTVLVVSAPPSVPFIAASAAKIKGAGYNLIIQDKYPEILTAVGKANPDSMFIKSIDKLNVWLYSGADRIITVGRDMRELIEKQLEYKSSRIDQQKEKKEKKAKKAISVIQNWASLEEIEPTERSSNELLKELGILEKFVLMYAGNMGHPQDLESIVDCAKKLKNDSRFHFLFIGSGVKRKWLEKKVRENNLKNVTVLNPRPRAEQKVFLNACDVGLVSLVKNMRGVAMPSRTYNLMAAGKPVLALTEENSEVARVIEEDKIGWFVPPSEPAKLLEVIYKIYNERNLLDQIGQRARESALAKYSVGTAVEKYEQIFRVR